MTYLWLMPLVSTVFAALFWTPVLLLLAMYFAGFWWTAAVLALYAPLYLDPVQTNPKRSRRTTLMIESPMWKSCIEWFRMTMKRSDAKAEFDPKRRRMWLAHPHGINTYQFAGLASELLDFKNVFPGLRYPRLAMASVMFRIPVLRDLFLSYGAIDAGRRTLTKAFECGEDVILVPGGSQEVLLMQPGEDTVYLEKRKGFVRLALQQGVDLVPTYCFGAVDAYSQVQIPAFKRMMSRIVSAFQFVIPVYWGYFFSPVPYRRDQTMVVGSPIPVKKVAEPTKEQVDELHAVYVTALRDLFDKHKEELGFGDRSLRVV